jgi:hypothetical protein
MEGKEGLGEAGGLGLGWGLRGSEPRLLLECRGGHREEIQYSITSA